MKIGFHVPQWGRSADREGVLAVARAAELAGLDSIWVADHVVVPVGSDDRYPYAAETPFRPEDGFLEALTTLAVVAGACEQIRIGTSVLVLPMRHPVTTAKVAATLDVLSAGRLTLAVGAGWWRQEFEALDAAFDGRGRRFDEQIEIMRTLWSGRPVEFNGEHYSIPEVVCKPTPVDPKGPRILVGGMSGPAMRRAGRLGDGWHAVGVHAATLSEGAEKVREAAAREGRDPSHLSFSTSTVLPDEPEVAVRRMRRLSDLGIEEVVLETGLADHEEICKAIERFADTVLPELS